MSQDPFNTPYPDNSGQGRYPNDPYQNPQANDPYAAPATNPQDPYAAGGYDPYAANPGGYDPYAAGPNPDPYVAAPGNDPYGSNPNMDPYAAQPGTDPYAGQGYPGDPVGGQPGYADPYTANSFTEKKSGNKTFLIALIAFIVVLIGVASVLVYFNLQGGGSILGGNDNPTPNGENPAEENPQLDVNVSETGGEGSPATLARQSSNATVPNDWLSRRFQGQPYVDAEGQCEDENRCGPNADPDNDGVINAEEYNFDTDPLNSDTDRDGIADGDELYVYYTDPTAEDSDGDTFKDFVELINCYDPTARTEDKMNPTASDGFLNLNKIEANVELNPLRSVTQSSFRREEATTADIAKGYIAERCIPPAPEPAPEEVPAEEVPTEEPAAPVQDPNTEPPQDPAVSPASNEPRI
jgi:hypothetical protein